MQIYIMEGEDIYIYIEGGGGEYGVNGYIYFGYTDGIGTNPLTLREGSRRGSPKVRHHFRESPTNFSDPFRESPAKFIELPPNFRHHFSDSPPKGPPVKITKSHPPTGSTAWRYTPGLPP